MRRVALTLSLVMLAFVFAFTMVGGAIAKAETMTITGKVEQGKIVADNGKEYMVFDDAKGKELMKDHMGHKVELKGKLEDKSGQEVFVISSIKHLSNG